MKIRDLTARLAWLTFAACVHTAFAADARSVSAQQFREDIAFIRQTIVHTHPDIGFSASAEAVEQALHAAGRDTPASMTRDQVWQRLAVLNAVFADAHLFVGYPDWREEARTHLASGGALFPYEVEIAPDGQLLVRAELGGAPTPLQGTRILAINGVPANMAVNDLLQRTHGDTPLFRSHLLSQRWWLYHWKLYGLSTHYRLRLEQDGRQWSADLPASTQTPAVLRDAGVFERQFGLVTVPGCAAVLKAGSFDYAFKERFLAFTREAFTRLREQRIPVLFVDIRANGGGDDELWLEGLMPYLATQPYRTGSTYTKREKTGQIAEGAIETWRLPQPDNPLLFQGKVVVMLGPATYSSAVLFANVMHDFRFATLSGAGAAARRTQSGGIRRFALPHGDLVLWAPRFILAPPAGGERDALLVADAPLEQLPVPACAKELAAPH